MEEAYALELRKAKGLSPEVPRAEVERRIKAVQALMAEEGFDGLFIYGSASTGDWVRYLSNYVHTFPPAQSFLVVPQRGGLILLIDCWWHQADAQEMSWAKEVRAFPHGRFAWQFKEFVRVFRQVGEDLSLGRGKVGISPVDMPTFYDRALKEALPEAHFGDALDLWARLVESPSEFDAGMIRRTAAIGDAGMQAALESCREGVPEYEVCMESLRTMASLGAEFLHGAGNSTHINIGSTSRVISNVRPFLFTGRRLQRGDMFWVDLTISYGGYFVDFDRTVVIGEPSAKQREIYGVCRRMLDTMAGALRPGVTGSELFRIGLGVAKEAGYGDVINHVYLGHGTGITTSERPYLTEGETKAVQAGRYINLEPGVFVPEVGSSSLEDVFFIKETGAEFVTQCKRDFHVA